MAMPNELVFVRHGHSEGNEAGSWAKKGDHRFYTPDFRKRPGHQWRLTDDGRKQAHEAGKWIANIIGATFDRYYVSPTVRTRETAALLGLPNAQWHVDQRLRERDFGDIGAMPQSVFEEIYSHSAFIKKIDGLYWRPPGGESIADIRLRVRSFFDTLHRECEGKRVIVVAHSKFMSAARSALEYMSDEEWVAAEEDEARKIRNGHVYHYTRLNPVTQTQGERLSWVRDICPSYDQSVEPAWREVTRKTFTSEELLEQVRRVEPIAFTSLPPEPWTTYFESFPDGARDDEYGLIPLDKLVPTKGPQTDALVEGRPIPMLRAYRYMAALAEGQPGAGKREPISVQKRGDGRYDVLDGNATLAAAKKLGWTRLPSHIAQPQEN